MLDPYKSIYEKRKLKYIICEEKITVKWGSGGIEQFSMFFLKLIALISWLQYYKLKPLKPLFSRCKNDCCIVHVFLSNKHNQSCSKLPHQNWVTLNKERFCAQKNLFKFLLPEQYQYAQIRQWFLHIPEHIRRN